MDAENIGQHFNMSCITKMPFLHFPAKDNKAIILFSTLMFCRRNTHPVNFSPLLRFWGIRLCIICFDFFFLQTLELLGCILCCSFCQCTHLWTCRVNLLTDILAQCTSPPPSSNCPLSLSLHLTPSPPPCFSLHQDWHHQGGTQGPPHLLPITALQTPPQKRLQTVMKPRGTTWDLGEEQSADEARHQRFWRGVDLWEILRRYFDSN